MKGIARKFLAAIKRHGMLNEGDGVVIALSGGPDSVTLFHLLTRFRDTLSLGRLVAAHVNYSLRGVESEGDQTFVEELASEKGVELYVKVVPPGRFRKTVGENFQKAARKIRYDHFREVAKSASAHRIALGHTLDDQAETVFMRFMEGQGIKGMKGIAPVTEGNVIRPLIGISREEILRFLRSESLAFRTDKSNSGRAYARNRVRNEAFPFLSRMTGRDVRRTVVHAGDLFTQLDELVDRQVDDMRRRCVKDEDMSISLLSYRKYPEIIRKSFLVTTGHRLLGVELNRRIIGKIDALLTGDHPSFHIDLPGGFFMERSYDTARISREKKKDEDFFEIIEGPGITRLGKGGGTLSVELREKDEIGLILQEVKKNIRVSAFQGDKNFFPLEVRNFREGDRMVPFGMTEGKKLKKIFIEKKIPRQRRKSIPLVLSMKEIIWVPGVGRSNFRPLGGKHKKIVVLEYRGT